jgi:hypothetical protein
MSVLLVGLLVAAALLLGLWLTWTANRLDRMHHRIDVARERLDAELLHRSGVAVELAASDALDPASRLVLLDAAHHARSAHTDDVDQQDHQDAGAGGHAEQEQAESALTQALRAVIGEVDDLPALRRHPGTGPLLEELAHACTRVELSRRFHNDAVVAARALRSRRRVRWLRLAGRAADLRAVDLDDVPPRGLTDA